MRGAVNWRPNLILRQLDMSDRAVMVAGQRGIIEI